MEGASFARRIKKDVLGGYVRLLESIDPQVATHILTAQKEAFIAGQKFFEIEAGHAEKALNKIRAKQEEKGSGI